MFLYRNVANYPKIISVTPSYLEQCSVLEVSGECFHIYKAFCIETSECK